jgi:hypothetical protein
MLTGIGTILGAFAIGVAAFVGRETVEGWKRQKKEERRMDAAERILTLAYELRSLLEAARSPLTEAWELNTAENDLTEANANWAAGLTENQQRQYRLAQATLNRFKHHKETWQRVWTLKPLALAFFGEEVEQLVHVFWAQRAVVTVAAQTYAEVNPATNPDLYETLQHRLWASGDGDDVIAGAVAGAINGLQTLLLPELRAAATIPTAVVQPA